MNKEINMYDNIDKSMFDFASESISMSDSKIETKQVGYLKDAWMRFKKNKASITGAIIILFLGLFAIIAPIIGESNYTKSINDTEYLYYKQLLPKSELFSNLGFWDGHKSETFNQNMFNYYTAIGVETGLSPIVKITKDAYEVDSLSGVQTYYGVEVDSYYKLGMKYLTLTKEQYQSIMDYQDEKKIQVIYPAVEFEKDALSAKKTDANVWYKINKKGYPIMTNGEFTKSYMTTGADEYTSTLRVEDDPYLTGDIEGAYRYAKVGGTTANPSYTVRVSLYNYFVYTYGEKPAFLFGSDNFGQDIFTRLGSGARFSFLLAIFVSLINLTIGAIYGAVSGYYGGNVDLIMERITDILGGIPFVVVTTLFQLHLKDQVGVLPSLLFAFVTTGWIGMAATMRMQFYRYKGQEYVLAARTLGAKNKRIIFKHILPNTLGTIVTSSVLVIPGVIFSESSLTYLGIVNLESSNITSVGTLLAHGKDYLATYPHIIFFPAMFISLLMISFNLFGNGLRDAFNPSLRGTED